MAERCVVAAETLDRYRQAVPDIGRVAHRQSGGLQNRVRERSIRSSPAIFIDLSLGVADPPWSDIPNDGTPFSRLLTYQRSSENSSLCCPLPGTI
jgi:hypothetical protein